MIHDQSSLQGGGIQAVETEALLEELFIDFELDSAREMLASHERFDDVCNLALLVNIHKRFQVHGFRKRSQCREYFRVGWRVKVGCDRVYPKQTAGSCRIDKGRQLVQAMKL